MLYENRWNLKYCFVQKSHISLICLNYAYAFFPRLAEYFVYSHGTLKQISEIYDHAEDDYDFYARRFDEGHPEYLAALPSRMLVGHHLKFTLLLFMLL